MPFKGPTCHHCRCFPQWALFVRNFYQMSSSLAVSFVRKSSPFIDWPTLFGHQLIIFSSENILEVLPFPSTSLKYRYSLEAYCRTRIELSVCLHAKRKTTMRSNCKLAVQQLTTHRLRDKYWSIWKIELYQTSEIWRTRFLTGCIELRGWKLNLT